MSTAAAAQAGSSVVMTMADAVPATSDPTPRPRSLRRGGRGRGGPRRPHPASNSTQDTSPTLPLQSEFHAEITSSTPSETAYPRRAQRGSHTRTDGRRGRGRGRVSHPGKRNNDMETRLTGASGRRFEGRLSRPGDTQGNEIEVDEADGTGQSLRAEAPEFAPGQTLVQTSSTPLVCGEEPNAKVNTKSRERLQKPQKVTTKSTAPDIATRTHEDIVNSLYECPICTSELGRRSRIWSCRLCWTVFHLSCVKKWSENEGSAIAQDAAQRQNGEEAIGSPRAWRCPGCNLRQEVLPTAYTCWCEKEVDPRPLPGLPPHSCGQTCSRPRAGCPHPCDATCHAGPCAPCTAMGPTLDCFCGRHSSTKRCQDTDYEHGWSCGEICGDLLPCGKHTCSRPCHEGLCGTCEVKVDAKCYCGRVQTQLPCSARDEELDCRKLIDATSQVEEWVGSFNCGAFCHRPFDCGKHFCEKLCHKQDALPSHCPRSPDVVSYCPCGKTLLIDILGYTARASCEDPIPNCQAACAKILPCGHPCDKICHPGLCGLCWKRISIQCRCGRSTSTTVCHQGDIEPPQCARQCKATLHCGRHTCTERCCPGEQKAIERQSLRRKLRSHLRPADSEIEAEHICTRVCGRTLKCGRHACPELCHKGACNTCREAIFDEISCHCGRTVLYPPLPCGTQPPPCPHPCQRSKECGHPQTAHNCHTDVEDCPKCPFLAAKICLCGKKVLKNQPCWLSDARCGQICGKPLKCGSHCCQKNCHRPGECEDALSACQQRCGKVKTMCGHTCTEPCHAPYPCPEKNPCSAAITVTCACGRLRQDRRCNAAKSVVSKGQLQQPQRLPALTPLACDDECARLERNRSLASALGVDIDASTTAPRSPSQPLSSSNLPYSSETLDMYLQLSSTSPLSTLQTYESTLHSLAISTTLRSVRFQPAKAPLRAFVHSLATDWGFVTESFDPEPHRHVFVLKPSTWMPPLFGLGNGTAIGIGGMSVGECVKTRERLRLKEREAQRLAAAEAKALKETIRSQATSSSDGGWAQVASRTSGRKPDAAVTAIKSFSPSSLAPFSSTMYAALSSELVAGADNAVKKTERLVLRSSVGAAKKQLNLQTAAEVADNWEEAEDKEEQQEEEQEQEEERKLEEQARDIEASYTEDPAAVAAE